MVAGCGNFQDPDIVIDFRVLGMSASVPEQAVDLDITKPPMPADILSQLVDSKVCVLLSDRNFERNLRWTMTLCGLDNERCPDDNPHSVLGSGLWSDPDLAATPP